MLKNSFKDLRKVTLIFSLVLLVIFFTINPVQAEDSAKADSSKMRIYLLKETVVTANRYKQDAFNLPQSLSIITRDKIEKENPQIVSDLFRELPGVEVNDAGPFRTRPVIRGMFGSRVLILVDGERLNDTRESTFSGAQLSLVDIGQVERIEVIHGPGSILYGSDALGGVINIITKKPEFSKNNRFSLSGNLNLKYSTIDKQRKARLELTGGNDRWGFLLGGNIRKAEDYKSPQGKVVNSALDQDDNLDFKGEYNLTPKQSLTLEGQRFRAEGIGYPGTPNEFTPKFYFPYHNRDKIALRYEAKNLTSHLLSLKSKVYYQKMSKNFESDLSTLINLFPPMTLRSFSRTLSDIKIFGASFQELFLTSKDQHLTWGLDYYREIIDGSRYLRTTVSDTVRVLREEVDTHSTVPENNLDALGIYVNNEYIPFNEVLLTMGLRYDYFNTKIKETSDYLDYREAPPKPFPSKTQSSSSLNGGIGIVYRLTDHLNLTANVASAFRVPNVVEKYFFGRASGTEFVIPNYDLSPEKSVNLDLGLKANFPKIFSSLTFFLNNYKDYIELESTGDSITLGMETLPIWHYANISEVRIQGVEAAIEAELPLVGLYSYANLTYTRGDNLSLDQPIFVAPFKLFFGLGWKEREDKIRVELNWRHVEDQKRVPKDSEGKYLDKLPTEGFDILNLEASLNLFKWQSLNLSLNNLADELYSEPYNATNPYNPVVEPGRNLIVSLLTRF